MSLCTKTSANKLNKYSLYNFLLEWLITVNSEALKLTVYSLSVNLLYLAVIWRELMLASGRYISLRQSWLLSVHCVLPEPLFSYSLYFSLFFLKIETKLVPIRWRWWQKRDISKRAYACSWEHLTGKRIKLWSWQQSAFKNTFKESWH